MKIIIINNCNDCPYAQYGGLGVICRKLKEIGKYDVPYDMDDCPLKPMPKELSTPYMFRQEMIALGLQNKDGTVSVYSEDYMYGWNDCINEITGETE
ncbi:MAG: hypothetical protein IJJ01_07520 [Firmicutes bacterium]|nr:hypothetical protein [Bacillota bacterium]